MRRDARRRGFLPLSFALLLCVCPPPASPQPTPSVPLLESYDDQVRQDEREKGGAQAIPQLMTICTDRTARRCWTEAGATACETEGATGEVFAVVVVAGAESDAGPRLEQCWSEMKVPPD